MKDVSSAFSLFLWVSASMWLACMLILSGCEPVKITTKRYDARANTVEFRDGQTSIFRAIETPEGWLVYAWGHANNLEYVPDPEHMWFKPKVESE